MRDDYVDGLNEQIEELDSEIMNLDRKRQKLEARVRRLVRIANYFRDAFESMETEHNICHKTLRQEVWYLQTELRKAGQQIKTLEDSAEAAKTQYAKLQERNKCMALMLSIFGFGERDIDRRM